MCSRAAEIQSFQRSSVLRPTDQRTESKELIQTLFAGMKVSAIETVSPFEIQRRDHLSRNDQVTNAWRIHFQLRNNVLSKLVLPRGPIALSEFVWCKLRVDRHHVFTRRRK